MTSVCQRCALRMQRNAHHELAFTSARFFSSTRVSQKSLPSFERSSNAELNEVLHTLRNEYLIPAYMRKRERHMLFSPKFKRYLTDNPITTKVDDEEVTLRWLGDNDRPKLEDLIKRVTHLIFQGDHVDYGNLVPLLRSTREGLGKRPHQSVQEKMVRKAVEAGHMDVVIRLLRSVRQTGVSLELDGVRQQVLLGLRQQGQRDEWAQEQLATALRNAQAVALMFESADHGAGTKPVANDPRGQPATIAVFLELAAVYVYKYQNAKDVSGKVKMYADRLVDSLQGREIEVRLHDREMQWDMLSAISVENGLRLAIQMAGRELQNVARAESVVSELARILSECAQKLDVNGLKEGSFNHQALTAYRSRVQ